MNVYTMKNTLLALKEPPLSAGGEGAVYEILGYPNRVAKIYHDTTDAKQREEKITAMVNISNGYGFRSANLSKDIAWPMSPLFDNQHNFVGFGMLRIQANTELDDLYTYPPTQKSAVNIKDRVHILINLCDVIDRLHMAGQVFGDFNPNNIKVKADGTVNFVDADSYHVKNGTKEYRCVVCAPGYVAPEVIKACKGTNYADCPHDTFTKSSDNFALAIHVFRMLMNGCHPFICERHLNRAGSAPAPKSTDKRVECGETPFFKNIPNYTTPHYAPELNSFPPYIKDLFKRAFVDGHASPGSRPSAAEWKTALVRFEKELIPCNHGNHDHYYWKGYHTCPYCEADLRHNQKMGRTLPAAVTSSNGRISTNNNRTSSYVPQNVAAQTISSPASTSNAGWFWFITIACAVLIQILLGMYVLPGIYWEVFGEEVLVSISVVGSIISGIVGSYIYNTKWSNGCASGYHEWWEYALSVLTSLGFTVGFGIAMALAILVLYIIAYILVGALIIGAIIGAFSGG